MTAAHIFSAKNTHARDIKKPKILAKKSRLWKTANGGDPYTSPQDDVKRDGDNQEEYCDEKVGKKTFTKIQFREP